ncbi:MAG: hypothetical protein AMXMBFR84_46880 [Candidatus Hydrogenedentota bacterium]
MLAIYILSLGLSTGLFGVFSRRMLADFGYVPDFSTGVVAACGVAAGYLAFQIGYVAVVRFFWPTKTSAPLLAEALSHASCLVFVPYLMNVSIPWPHPALATLAPLIFLAAFVGVHTVLKLFAFYCILYSLPGTRAWTPLWLGCSAAAALICVLCVNAWAGAVRTALPVANPNLSLFRVGGMHYEAMPVPEGAVVKKMLPDWRNEALVFHWALPPETEVRADDLLDDIYVTIVFPGKSTKRISRELKATGDGWISMRVDPSEIPEGAESCEIIWYNQRETGWLTFAEFRPVALSNRALLLAGPFQHVPRQESAPPNVVLIAIDDLCAGHMSIEKYEGASTAAMDRLAKTGLYLPAAYTASPDAKASAMTLLTGASPIEHGILAGLTEPASGRIRPLAAHFRDMGYATAAFTEGDDRNDLVIGSGFESGFDGFDSGYTREASEQGDALAAGFRDEGSRGTLASATTWIGDYKNLPFFVFIRLHELSGVEPRSRYGETVMAGEPSPLALYDAALTYMDSELDRFVKFIKENDTKSNTVIVLTATRGKSFDASGTHPTPDFVEDVLRTPVIINGPGIGAERKTGLYTTEDLAPTILTLAGATDGVDPKRNFLAEDYLNFPVSVGGDPLILAIRDDRWRFIWGSKRRAFTGEAQSPETAVELYPIRNFGWESQRSVAQRYPDRVRRWVDTLTVYHTTELAARQTAGR